MALMDDSKLLFMFPGQGSQYEQMGKDILEKYAKAKSIWAMASDIFGEDLVDICMNKPFREMQRTDRAQILIGAVSLSLIEILCDEGISADIVLGHSAGELSALYASGAVEIEDALKLISYRGKFMYEAAKNFKGKMVAVMNVDLNEVLEVMENYRGHGIVSLGNYNAPNQLVVTGDYETVTLFEKEMNKNPSARIQDLKQQGAWHSKHMSEAQLRFANEINKIPLRKPSIPMIFNYSTEFSDDIENIRLQLINIITTTVNWYPCLCKLANNHGACFVEIGPNKILRGLLRRCYQSINMNSYEVMNVQDINTLDQFLAKTKERLLVENVV